MSWKKKKSDNKKKKARRKKKKSRNALKPKIPPRGNDKPMFMFDNGMLI